jgi:NADPH:quinone reductase-like Zn-dependent oxidoreductase
VKVVATGLHRGDWILLTGKPYLLRLMGFGLLAPKHPIPGMAVAGVVEAVGRNVRRFSPGDAVFGEIGGGGFAEYVCVHEHELAPKPAGVGFEEVATLPVSATTALQGLRDAGRLQAGQSVLINGAAGGVGTFAVQIAKALGARVTAVCSTANVEMVKSLGADDVIDYTQADFTAQDQRYDVILDLVGNRPLAACRRVLAERGRFVACAGGTENDWTGPMLATLLGVAGNLFSTQVFVPLAAKPNQQDLATVAGFVAAGQVRPVIGRRFALHEVTEGMRYLGTGHSRGKSVIVQ